MASMWTGALAKERAAVEAILILSQPLTYITTSELTQRWWCHKQQFLYSFCKIKSDISKIWNLERTKRNCNWQMQYLHFLYNSRDNGNAPTDATSSDEELCPPLVLNVKGSHTALGQKQDSYCGERRFHLSTSYCGCQSHRPAMSRQKQQTYKLCKGFCAIN